MKLHKLLLALGLFPLGSSACNPVMAFVLDASGGSTCTPGAEAPCYDGPPGTEGVGICKAGTRTCSPDGTSWGACEGEVLPRPADCASGMDLACEGKAPACTGAVLWAKTYGTTGDQFPTAISADSSGNVIVAGYSTGTVNFSEPAGSGAFVTKLDAASGACLWAKHYETGLLYGAAVAPSGDIFVAGHIPETQTIDFGCGAMASPGTGDAFIAKLSGAGACVWSTHFGALGAEVEASGIGIDPAGSVIVAGEFSGAVDFGAGSLSSTGLDIFLLKLNGDSGAAIWSKDLGNPGANDPWGALKLAVDGSGDAILTGFFSGPLTLGDANPLQPVTSPDAFGARFDGSTGDLVWAKGFGVSGAVYGLDTAVSGSDQPLFVGSFSGTANLGAGTEHSAGLKDVFIAQTNSSGGGMWSRAFGAHLAMDWAEGRAVAADPAGNVILAGDFTNSIYIGGPPLLATGQAALVAKLDPSGAAEWVRTFGAMGTNDQSATAVGTGQDGSVLVTGTFDGAIDFGEGPSASVSGLDMFVVKLSP